MSRISARRLVRRLVRPPVLPLVVSLAFAQGAHADMKDHLERDWYSVETLFFRYLAPPDDEDFSRSTAPRHALGPAALAPPPTVYSERIAAEPPVPLDFPRLQQFDCIAPTPAPWLGIGDDAVSAAAPDAAPNQNGESGEGEMPETEAPPPKVAVPPIPTGPPAPTPAQRARWAIEEFERELMREAWRWRYDDLSLRTAATRLRRSDDYAILHHGRWLQPVPARDSAAPLLIQIGTPTPDATFELEGSVSVTLGRFIHFAAQVWLRQTPPDALAAPEPDPTGDASSGEPHRTRRVGDAVMSDGAGHVHLSESRRMRPGELHYLDHPWLGILVRIEPVEIPEALLELAAMPADG